MPAALPLLLHFLLIPSLAAQFVGGGAGFTALSGASTAAIGETVATSQYSAGTGPLAHAFAGKAFGDYFAAQGSWQWTRNRVLLTSAGFAAGSVAASQQAMRVAQNEFGVDGLVYFRNRASRVRPFLAVGLGANRFDSGTAAFVSVRGAPPPAASIGATRFALRFAAGIDLMHRSGWGFRYSFLETMTGNPVAEQLRPPGSGTLMTFQNLFGIVRYFR